MMKQLMVIPTLALSLFAATPSVAEGLNEVFESPNNRADIRTCDAPLASVAGSATAAYQYTYDVKEFKKIYQEAIRQAQAAGQPAPTADQVRMAIEDYSNKKLQTQFPGGTATSWVIEIRCRFRPRLECSIIITL